MGKVKLYLAAFLLITAAAFLLYSNIFDAAFVYDDVVFRDNPSIHITHPGQLLDILFDRDGWRRAGLIYRLDHPQLKRAGIIIGGLVILVFSYWTHERNRIWHDPVTLWEDNVKKSPNRARVRGNLGHFNLAAVYFNFRDYEKAESVIRKGISIWPISSELYGLLGVTLYHKGKQTSARAALSHALDLDSSNGMAQLYMNKLQ